MAEWRVHRVGRQVIEADSEAEAIERALAYPDDQWQFVTYGEEVEDIGPSERVARDVRWGSSYARGFRR